MENFSILECAIHVWKLLESRISLWFHGTRHESDLIHFKERLEKISSTVIKNTLKLIIARVVVETSIDQMGLIDFYWALLIAHHKFLE